MNWLTLDKLPVLFTLLMGASGWFLSTIHADLKDKVFLSYSIKNEGAESDGSDKYLITLRNHSLANVVAQVQFNIRCLIDDKPTNCIIQREQGNSFDLIQPPVAWDVQPTVVPAGLGWVDGERHLQSIEWDLKIPSSSMGQIALEVTEKAKLTGYYLLKYDSPDLDKYGDYVFVEDGDFRTTIISSYFSIMIWGLITGVGAITIYVFLYFFGMRQAGTAEGDEDEEAPEKRYRVDLYFGD